MQDNFELFLWKTVPVRSTCVEGREQEVVLATRLELLVSSGIAESLAPVLSEFTVAHIACYSLDYVCKRGPEIVGRRSNHSAPQDFIRWTCLCTAEG